MQLKTCQILSRGFHFTKYILYIHTVNMLNYCEIRSFIMVSNTQDEINL